MYFSSYIAKQCRTTFYSYTLLFNKFLRYVLPLKSGGLGRYNQNGNMILNSDRVVDRSNIIK